MLLTKKPSIYTVLKKPNGLKLPIKCTDLPAEILKKISLMLIDLNDSKLINFIFVTFKNKPL
jgi:hypothetical protein